MVEFSSLQEAEDAILAYNNNRRVTNPILRNQNIYRACGVYFVYSINVAVQADFRTFCHVYRLGKIVSGQVVQVPAYA